MGTTVKRYLKENFVDSFKLVDRRLIKKKINGLLLGQFISLLIAGTAIFSQLLVIKYGVNMPTAQSLLNYILLMFYSIVLIRRGTFWKTIKTKSLMMIPLAFIDVEANYVVVKAYQYGSITSIMLLDCFTIPVVVVLSRIFLKTRYTLVHLLAVTLSIVGMVVLFVSDLVQGEDAGGGTNPLLGDFLCLISSTLYAISNVGQEFTVKKYDRITYLALIGIYGSIISGVQLAIFERNELATMDWNSGATGYMVGFALCLFIMYSATPFMMEIAGATLMNLSLLTSDIFGIVAAILLFDRQLSWLYFLSFVIIVSALAIYNLSQPHIKSSEIKNLMDDANKAGDIQINESQDGANTDHIKDSIIINNDQEQNVTQSPSTSDLLTLQNSSTSLIHQTSDLSSSQPQQQQDDDNIPV
ncbi:putative transmembrane protein [Cavenderia fasciculata]|uniref:Transmembrane protein n=1 Tax=Cavenderia fasciculata TaxID=261658 RepID=F4PMA2_CACFS|nr:putative transmembrane protein [Cavenderia fasciculata]EGG23602.1 putative transmembrane protein [Cavenderia fasciculata]|eukprot:XP_004361453.1 putative transmembrane protein [Cavenderia fasciculata]